MSLKSKALRAGTGTRALGAKIANSRRLRGVGVAAGLSLVAGHGFAQGAASQDLSDSFYDITMGDPKADLAIFGTELNPISMAMPFPWSPMSVIQNRAPGQQMLGSGGGAMLGAGVGATAGATAGAMISNAAKGRLKGLGWVGGVAGGLIGAASGAIGGSQHAEQLMAMRQLGLINKTTVSDYARNYNYYDNSMPTVDGSIVFGMRDSRFGG